MNFPTLNADQVRTVLVNSGEMSRAQRLRATLEYSSWGHGVYYRLTYAEDVFEWAVLYISPETMMVCVAIEGQDDFKEIGDSLRKAFDHNTGVTRVRDYL